MFKQNIVLIILIIILIGVFYFGVFYLKFKNSNNDIHDIGDLKNGEIEVQDF